LSFSSALKMKTIYFSKMSADFHQTDIIIQKIEPFIKLLQWEHQIQQWNTSSAVKFHFIYVRLIRKLLWPRKSTIFVMFTQEDGNFVLRNPSKIHPVYFTTVIPCTGCVCFSLWRNMAVCVAFMVTYHHFTAHELFWV
jgi:hypothetical protein